MGDTHNTVDCGANKYTKSEITVTRINLFRGVTHNEVEKSTNGNGDSWRKKWSELKFVAIAID